MIKKAAPILILLISILVSGGGCGNNQEEVQTADTPVRLVVYPGEAHGNRNTAARYDYSLRLMRWMDHYLKGEGGDPPPYELDHAQKIAEKG